MFRKSLIVCAMLAGASSSVVAAPFMAQDPRTLGMGGASVAASNSGTASFYNPALLAVAHPDEDFNLELAVAGRIADPNELLQSISDFADNDYVTAFDNALLPFTAPDATHPAPTDSATFVAAQTALNTATVNLKTGLRSMSNKPMEAQLAGGLAISIPSRNFAGALTVGGWSSGGFVGEVTNHDLGELDRYIGVITGVDPNILGVAQAILDIAANPLDVNTMDSYVKLQAGAFQEIGLSLAKEYEVAGQNIAFGITPKMVKATTYENTIVVGQMDTASTSTSQGAKDSTGFTMDFGMARDYGNGWKSGFTVRNLIPQSYKTISGDSLTVDPSARVGVARDWERATLAMDLDVTNNKPLGIGNDTQYLSLGGELDLWLLELRAGYRHNIPDSDASVVTAGLGLYLFGLTIDAAAAANTDNTDVSGALQVGYKF
ncbi:MAG: conjugal transfer protein TraF [Gammaproteobacteria bacterium]|nr:conjugal transfer protein TraF [Gammaproteobacteria bacterium]